MSVAGPDQAIGWVIALACFFINFILAGLNRSAGVLYVALIDLYGASREAASTPFSIRVCVRNMSGPLIGLLGQKYGIRKVTVLGGFVGGLGSILCHFAPNITYITLFWGIIHGTGLGLATVIHMMIISQYFDKYRASALGLGYSGDCFGSFAFPVIIESLIKSYGIKGAFLILGGIVLNVVPMAMMLKKPPWLESNKKKENFHRNILEEQETNVGLSSYDKNGKGIPNQAFKSSNESLSVSEILPTNEYDDASLHSNNATPFPNSDRVYRPSLSSYSSTRSCKQCIRRKTPDLSEPYQENKEGHNSLPPLFEKETFPSGQPNVRESEIGSIQEGEENSTIADEDIERVEDPTVVKKRTTSNLSQMAYDIVHRVRTASFASQVASDGYIACLKQEQENFTVKDNANSLEDEVQLSSCKSNEHPIRDVEESKQQTALEDQGGHSSSVLRTLLRTNAKPIFILISMSMATYAFLFVGTFTIIIDYATDYGISEDEAKYLIIGFSITDLIGRLGFGQVIDRKLLKMKNYAGMTMVLMGASMVVMPLNRSFSFMMVCMCACGLIQGGTAIMFPILVSLYMEKDEESIAMGCFNFYGGLLMLPLSSMIGFFRDNTGSYDMVFYLQGSIVIAVGLIWQLEPLILRCSKKPILSPLNSVKATKL